VSVPQRSSSQRPLTDLPASGNPVVGPAYWLVLVLRAIPAAAVGLLITFMEDHSPRVGLIAFGVFAVTSGLVLLVGTVTTVLDRTVRGVLIGQGVISVVTGGAAIVLWGSSIGMLLFIVTIYAALTGVLELYAGIRSRGAQPARDWVTVGAYTAVAAIVFVLIPPDSILATGLVGAYGIVLAVFLLIAGLSLKWADEAPQTTGAEAPSAVEGKVSS
jgi:uncharacterized membrane protein HdeD (DUF308 family)